MADDLDLVTCRWCGRSYHWTKSGRGYTADGPFCSDKCEAEYKKQQDAEREARDAKIAAENAERQAREEEVAEAEATIAAIKAKQYAEHPYWEKIDDAKGHNSVILLTSIISAIAWFIALGRLGAKEFIIRAVVSLVIAAIGYILQMVYEDSNFEKPLAKLKMNKIRAKIVNIFRFNGLGWIATVAFFAMVKIGEGGFNQEIFLLILIGVILRIVVFILLLGDGVCTYGNIEKTLFIKALAPLILVFLPAWCEPFAGKLFSPVEQFIERKSAASFEKSYTPEMDVIVGQTYTIGYNVNTKTGAIEPQKDVLFAKNGYIMGVSGNSASRTYSVDTVTRTVTTKKTKKNPAWEIRYFKDGSGIYSTGDDKFCSAKDGAAFNAENATEVIGKTFSGKWSDKFTASVTFGKNGIATVKFSDGDKGSGAYIASDDDNVVLYNHNNKGVWFAFTYSDTSDEAAFMRFAAEKKSNGSFKDSPRAYSYRGWKKK